MTATIFWKRKPKERKERGYRRRINQKKTVHASIPRKSQELMPGASEGRNRFENRTTDCKFCKKWAISRVPSPALCGQAATIPTPVEHQGVPCAHAVLMCSGLWNTRHSHSGVSHHNSMGRLSEKKSHNKQQVRPNPTPFFMLVLRNTAIQA